MVLRDINKQTQDDAKQTNRFPRYQLLGKETNNINRRRQLLGSHARFIENSRSMTNNNTRRKAIKRSTLLIIRYHKQTMEFSLFFLFVYLKPKNERATYIKLSYDNYRLENDSNIIFLIFWEILLETVHVEYKIDKKCAIFRNLDANLNYVREWVIAMIEMNGCWICLFQQHIHENSIISCVLYVQKREVREEKTSKQGYGGGVYNDNRYITTSLDPFQGNGLSFPLNTGLPFSYGLKM